MTKKKLNSKKVESNLTVRKKSLMDLVQGVVKNKLTAQKNFESLRRKLKEKGQRLVKLSQTKTNRITPRKSR